MATPASTSDSATTVNTVLNSTFPVYLPADPVLFLSEDEFQQQLRKILIDDRKPGLSDLKDEIDSIANRRHAKRLKASGKREAASDAQTDRIVKSPFVAGLQRHQAHVVAREILLAENKALTQNLDVTHVSSNSPLVDLFYDIGEKTLGKTLEKHLDDAWQEDPLMTLKIIFNVRSIHLGKSSKIAAYKAFGWLAEHHPMTLLANLKWLVRPVIDKKAGKSEDKKGEDGAKNKGSKNTKAEDEDFEMIGSEEAAAASTTNPYDVRFGVSHGYWKDLLNLLALAANNQLTVHGNPSSVLTQERKDSGAAKSLREWDQVKAKGLRKEVESARYARVLDKLANDDFYRCLHQTVARLFAKQLKTDSSLLQSDKLSEKRKISLAGKWAPTMKEFHDKHTFIQTSIAEILFPNPGEVCPDATDRELYIRHAREAFRKSYSSPLRKALSVVERSIAANRFDEIKYERVPSIAMDRYSPLFLKKDLDHFTSYIDKVASGGAKISGAVLLPSTLISKARELANQSLSYNHHQLTTTHDVKRLRAATQAKTQRKVLDAQWTTLVNRIRNSGILTSSIAICDVSGSMNYPTFKDKSKPMDSSIGLSLLLAEVTEPPFGGTFITFSQDPAVLSVGGSKDSRDLVDKVKYMVSAPWGMNTDFCKVFENLILPMAVNNRLKQEDMVKQVFVFSDMQFDAASTTEGRWTTSFERIRAKFQDAGYEMPKFIFWNLAGDATQKPVTNDEVNTALVSGYSQGMLKTFLDGGGFEDPEAEVEVEEREGEDGVVEVVGLKPKMDPLAIVRKAVSHPAFGMLEVFD